MTADIWERIEDARRRWNVLEHPFYQRWSAGELSIEDLARYSGQYRHATQALARASALAAEEAPEVERSELHRHAREEAEHVELWDGFLDAVGGDRDAPPTAETAECVEEWTSGDDFPTRLIRLYAIESSQPAISQTKREGLAAHYGISGGSGSEYFRLHETADVAHAAEGRALIDRHASDADTDTLVAAAESTFAANWRLLDGV